MAFNCHALISHNLSEPLIWSGREMFIISTMQNIRRVFVER